MLIFLKANVDMCNSQNAVNNCNKNLLATKLTLLQQKMDPLKT